MITASTYLPRINSSTTAASSIQGTGAQNLANALRIGCSAVSGIEFGPELFRRACASMAVRPTAGFGSARTPTVAGAALNVASSGRSAYGRSSVACFSCVVDTPSLLLVSVQISPSQSGGRVIPRVIERHGRIAAQQLCRECSQGPTLRASIESVCTSPHSLGRIVIKWPHCTRAKQHPRKSVRFLVRSQPWTCRQAAFFKAR